MSLTTRKLSFKRCSTSNHCIFLHLEIPCKRFQAVTIVTGSLWNWKVEAKKGCSLWWTSFLFSTWNDAWHSFQKKRNIEFDADALPNQHWRKVWWLENQNWNVSCAVLKFFLRFLSGINGCWDVSFHVHHQYWPYDKN